MTDLHVFAKSHHKYMSAHKDEQWLFTIQLPTLPVSSQKFVLKQYLAWTDFHEGMQVFIKPGTTVEVIDFDDLDKCGCREADIEFIRIMCMSNKNLVPARTGNGDLISVNYEDLVQASI